MKNSKELDTYLEILDMESPMWIRTSELHPPKGMWVLVAREDWQKPYEMMCYMGTRTGRQDKGDGWEDYEYSAWTSGYGDISAVEPEFWMFPSGLPSGYEQTYFSYLRSKLLNKYGRDLDALNQMDCLSPKQHKILSKVISEIRTKYQEAVADDYVVKPMSYTLYHLWQKWDSKEKNRK